MKYKTVFFIMLHLSYSAVSQDACLALLNHGLYDEIIVKGLSTNYSDIQNEFCSAYSSFKSDTKGGSVKASYKVFSGKAKYSNSKIEKIGSFLCDSSKEVNDIYNNKSSLKRLINPQAVLAFSQCVDNSRNNLIIDTFYGNSTLDSIVISLRYSVKGDSNSRTPVERVQFDSSLDCTGTLLDLSKNESNLLGNSAKSLTCKRKIFDEPKTKFGDDYWFFGGDITISTGDSTIVRRLPQIGVQQKDDPSVNYPIGMILSSVLAPSMFFSGEVPGIDPKQWRPVNGLKYPENSQLAGLFTTNNYPNLEVLKNSKIIIDISQQILNNGDNVKNTKKFKENSSYKWTWFAANSDTKGNRNGAAPKHWEWSEDQFQHGVDESGVVTAKGRTYDWKTEAWSAWGGGKANILGVAHIDYPKVYYYVKVD